MWEEEGGMPPWVRQLESAGDWNHVQAVRHPATRFPTEVEGIEDVQGQLFTCQVEGCS